ncbi:MAG: MFS transporter [Candidatus Campbellbacteria bacterium]|nr:MFS transporter [Candidatus Campbellbacteria bacterium]
MWNPFRQGGRISFTQLQTLYVFAFFLSFHAFLPSYANSTFLETFLTPQTVGVVFAVASILTLLVLFNLPTLLSRLGIFNTVLGLIILEAVTLIVLGTTGIIWLTIGAFVVHLFLARALFYTLDIFIESLSFDGDTGSIRGLLLTIFNASLMLSPLLVSFIIGEEELFRRMYLVSVVFLLPAVLLLLRNFRNFKDPTYEPIKALDASARVFKDKDLFNVFASHFLLRFFYAWMVIYTPIYLIQTIGFNWTEIGPIFTVMLLPFILFEIPFGKIADKYIGEKELLISGFVITSIATFALAFITTPSVVLWASILFLTRFGASMVEVMSEAYFFKKISSEESELVALFRGINPLAYIAAPVVSTIALLFMDIRYTFIILSAVVFTGIIYAVGIHDTR